MKEREIADIVIEWEVYSMNRLQDNVMWMVNINHHMEEIVIGGGYTEPIR